MHNQPIYIRVPPSMARSTVILLEILYGPDLFIHTVQREPDGNLLLSLTPGGPVQTSKTQPTLCKSINENAPLTA